MGKTFAWPSRTHCRACWWQWGGDKQDQSPLQLRFLLLRSSPTPKSQSCLTVSVSLRLHIAVSWQTSP